MNNKLYNVGIYLRLSNEDRDKLNKNDPSESIKNQRNMLLDYINKHSDFVLIKEYCDEDLSGAGTYRPEFEKLIKDCENGKINIVLCKSQSRFSRDMEIVEKYINNKFKEWHVRFISLSDNADTENYGNKKSRQINGLVNEWYLEDVSNNIRSAFNSKMKQGEFISPFASFGYEISKNDNNKIVVDEFASEIVKKIFNLYLIGMGYTSIAKYLNIQNIPSPSFYKYQKGVKLNIVSKKPREEIKWNANAIKNILSNELYIGNLIQGKRTTVSYKNHKIINKEKDKWIRKEKTHEAIIDIATFKKVQIYMKERTKPIKKYDIAHNFSGKVFCLECKKYMRKKNSTKHEYLVCSNSQNEYNACKNKISIRYDLLESLILNEINKKIEKYYDSQNLLENLKPKIKDKHIKKMKILTTEKLESENKLFKAKKYLKSLYEDKVNKVITNNQFKTLLNSYNKEENKISEQLKSISDEINYYKLKEKTDKDLINILQKYNKINKLNKIIVDEFIDKIYIGILDKEKNTRRIIIKWNLK